MPWHPKWSARGTQMDLWDFLHPLLQLLEFSSHHSTTIIIKWRLFVSWLQINPKIVSILVLMVVEIKEKRQWHWNPDGEECLCSLFVKSSLTCGTAFKNSNGILCEQTNSITSFNPSNIITTLRRVQNLQPTNQRFWWGTNNSSF